MIAEVDVVFLIISFVAVVSALGVLFLRNIMHAAFSLMLCLVMLALLYIYGKAEFVGATQLLVYVGGIVVLLIFGIMLSQVKKSEDRFSNKFMGLLIAASMSYAMIRLIFLIKWPMAKSGALSKDHVSEIGINFFTQNLLAFELAGILLLIALIAAMKISGKNDQV